MGAHEDCDGRLNEMRRDRENAASGGAVGRPKVRENRETGFTCGSSRWTGPPVCGYSTPSAIFRVPPVTIRPSYPFLPLSRLTVL